MKHIEARFEGLLFASRWLIAPVYFGLVLAMAMLLFKFGKEVWYMGSHLLHASGGDVITGVLTLVDIALVMNLLVIIIFSGYENFVSKMDLAGHEDRPDWMGHIGFSDLKIKVIGSIVAISGIELLKAFMNMENAAEFEDRQLIWMVVLHLVFVTSGIAYAIMDRLAAGKPEGSH